MRFSTFTVASAPLGIETSVLSGVRMRVERRLMSSTVPVRSPMRQVSPDADDFVAQERNASEEILQSFLSGESDGDTADAQSGECGLHVEAEGRPRWRRPRR